MKQPHFTDPRDHQTPFRIVRQGKDILLHCPIFNKHYLPHEVSDCGSLFHDSPHSDPGDENITYFLQTTDNIKGHVFDGYAVYGDADTQAFIRQVKPLTK